MGKDPRWARYGAHIREARGPRSRLDVIVALKTHVAESTLVNWELGYTCPTIGQLEQLAEALNVHLCQLVLGREAWTAITSGKPDLEVDPTPGVAGEDEPPKKLPPKKAAKPTKKFVKKPPAGKGKGAAAAPKSEGKKRA